MLAQLNGISLFYEECGSGRPLVLVHGNGEDHTIFDRAMEVLSASYHCYAIDSRDHGQSSKVEVLHYADMAEDVIALLEQLDLKDVIYYGFSDGGIIGLLSAMKTDRITDLIVSGANLTPAGVVPWLRQLMKVMNFLRPDRKLALMLEEPDITAEQLGTIHARTLVLAGSHDVVSEEETIRIAEGIPGARLRILDGEGHGSYIVHSRKIADLLYGWLKSGQ